MSDNEIMNVVYGISSTIKNARRKKGLTRKELAEKSGVSYESIVRIEYRKGSTTIVTLMLVLDALGLDLIIKEKSDD